MVTEKVMELKSADGALPRDISRFKKLHENGRAVIKANPDKTLGYVSTAELVNETVKTGC